jgi:hypothetical protein
MPLGDTLNQFGGIIAHGQVAAGTFGPHTITHGGSTWNNSIGVAPMDFACAALMVANVNKTSANSISALGILGTAPADSPFITASPPTAFLQAVTNDSTSWMGTFAMPAGAPPGGGNRFFGISLQNNDGGNDGTFTLEIAIILVPTTQVTLGNGPPWY